MAVISLSHYNNASNESSDNMTMDGLSLGSDIELKFLPEVEMDDWRFALILNLNKLLFHKHWHWHDNNNIPIHNLLVLPVLYNLYSAFPRYTQVYIIIRSLPHWFQQNFIVISCFTFSPLVKKTANESWALEASIHDGGTCGLIGLFLRGLGTTNGQRYIFVLPRNNHLPSYNPNLKS